MKPSFLNSSAAINQGALTITVRRKKETTQRLENHPTISGKHPIILGSSKITCYPKNNIKIKHGFG
jgi:hypothetical protein